MRVLLDECVPRHMGQFLTGHTVSTVQAMGWAGIKNGQLLALAEQNGLEVFVTADKNISYQQVIRDRSLGLVELPTNILPLLRSLTVPFQEAVSKVQAGQCISVNFLNP